MKHSRFSLLLIGSLVPLWLLGCATPATVYVEHKNYRQRSAYARDLPACLSEVQGIELEHIKQEWGVTGAGLAVGATTTLLAPAGLALLPLGVVSVGLAGGVIGATYAEDYMRKVALVNCLKRKGHIAFLGSTE